jgi:hypothetical protein
MGEILATIQHDDLEDGATETHDCAQITNTQYLTSYNWLNGGDHQIIVPGESAHPATQITVHRSRIHLTGEPPEWTPLSKPTQLREDSGIFYRDKNAARYPTYPLEPMIRAIMMERPDFRLDGLDIVACGSTLGNLLRFSRGQGSSFRMLVEVLGNTVFFMRRERSPTETITGVRGYGHTFPEAYTTWSKSVRRSDSHQRLINYDFAGMNCLVRFEADGYLPDLIQNDLSTQNEPILSTSNIDPEDLLSAIEAATISAVPPVTAHTKSATLKILKQGRYIPQCAVFDLKTRSEKRRGDDILSEELARLWVRQIPNFILAYHKFGRFDEIPVQDVREDLKQWEKSQQQELARFATLLQMVASFARSTEDGKLELEHEEGEKVLNLRIPGGVVGRVLPSSLTDHWDVSK